MMDYNKKYQEEKRAKEDFEFYSILLAMALVCVLFAGAIIHKYHTEHASKTSNQAATLGGQAESEARGTTGRCFFLSDVSLAKVSQGA